MYAYWIFACPYELGYQWTYNYEENPTPTIIAACKGEYKIELYGASGGCHTASMTGLGGYTSAYVKMEKGQVLYGYIGQQGAYTYSTLVSSSFNGGGNGGSGMNEKNVHLGGAGGGATDIRITNGSWNDFNSLKSRVMVAGGGGGCGCASAHNPGHGGGLVGVTTLNPSGTYYAGASASGGSQTSGGNSIGAYHSTSILGTTGYSGNGSFGIGSNAVQCGAGGGGGYYGGGSEYTAGGGGGSSYVKGCSGCDTTYTSYQGDLTFTNPILQQGKNTGNGKIVITLSSIFYK